MSKIENIEQAVGLRCFFAEYGIGSAVGAPAEGEGGFRLILVGLSLDEFKRLIAGANIELID